MKLHYIVRITFPSIAVIVLWTFYIYCLQFRVLDPKWDDVTMVSLAALIVSVFYIPCLALSCFVKSFSIPPEDELKIKLSMIGFILAVPVSFICFYFFAVGF
jgi:hypothetical protein